ncbi:MAG: hypothetical protein R2822_05395 [Spirosomataceae bacterium]
MQPELAQGGVYLVLKSADNTTYLLPTWPIRGGKRQFLTSRSYLQKGFVATFYNENFKPNTYRIGMLSL